MKNSYDLLKVFAILLVVIGHITILYRGESFGLAGNIWLTFLCTAIYLFHMPLFIALSGAIFQIGLNKGKYILFFPFLKNKILRIGIPFLAVGSLFLAPSLYFFKMSHGGEFLSIVYNVICCMGEERHLWYLPSLFWIFIIAWILNKASIGVFLSLITSILFALFYSLFINFNFMCLSNAIHYLPYFLVGMILQKYSDLVGKKMLLTGISLILIVGSINKITDLGWLDNLMGILLPIAFILSLFPLAKITLPKVQNNKIMQIILHQSYAIYLFHVMIIYAMYSILPIVLPTIIMVPLVFVCSIIGSMLTVYVLRRLHLQIIIGE